MKPFAFFGIALTGLIPVTGCQIPKQSKAPALSPGPRRVLQRRLRLSLGRQLENALLQPPKDLLTLARRPNPDWVTPGGPCRSDVSVGSRWWVYFDLLPGMDVWGLTIAQTKRALEKNSKNMWLGRRFRSLCAPWAVNTSGCSARWTNRASIP